MELDWLELTLRLAVAAFLGGLIGYQREAAERPAGLRTHILVSIGSALVMLVSLQFSKLSQADPSRIAAGAITGIGFLGAGTIIRQGNIVIGLTTAASLWTTAAIGFAIGLGFYGGAVIATILTLFVLIVFKKLEKRLTKHQHRLLCLTTSDAQVKLSKLKETLSSMNVSAQLLETEQLSGGKMTLRLTLEIPPKVEPEKILLAIARRKQFTNIKWEQ